MRKRRLIAHGPDAAIFVPDKKPSSYTKYIRKQRIPGLLSERGLLDQLNMVVSKDYWKDHPNSFGPVELNKLQTWRKAVAEKAKRLRQAAQRAHIDTLHTDWDYICWVKSRERDRTNWGP